MSSRRSSKYCPWRPRLSSPRSCAAWVSRSPGTVTAAASSAGCSSIPPRNRGPSSSLTRCSAAWEGSVATPSGTMSSSQSWSMARRSSGTQLPRPSARSSRGACRTATPVTSLRMPCHTAPLRTARPSWTASSAGGPGAWQRSRSTSSGRMWCGLCCACPGRARSWLSGSCARLPRSCRRQSTGGGCWRTLGSRSAMAPATEGRE
mmetsp:Transcript_49193/g.146939  ORF Transcript_49193/g.146939 Transcript_49193/m.146939 type:complete len:205 (+) Transcript_49193:485-1099(+)